LKMTEQMITPPELTPEAKASAARIAGRALTRHVREPLDAYNYLAQIFSNPKYDGAFRRLLLSHLPPDLVEAYKADEEQRAKEKAEQEARCKAQEAERKRQLEERLEYRRQHADRWIWGGTIDRGIAVYDSGHREYDREVIWTCPVCRTQEERDAKVAKWIRGRESDEIGDITRHVNESRVEEEVDESEYSAWSEEDWEERLTQEISDSALLEDFEPGNSWNQDYEFEGWDREVEDDPKRLIVAIQEALADNEIGGTLSKDNRVLALQKCLNEVAAEEGRREQLAAKQSH
jgi:hypothetical protein